MVEVRDGTRRLYLAKGDTLDIHIDASLPQHQIEGIRFLYRLFSKKKPGAILNDPSGYGKRVQTVLFLNAVRPLLDKPVLILCREGKEQKWVHRFTKWSRMGMEVSVQLFNPPVLKSFVYINPMCHINTFSRREWSVVIVDDTTITRDILRATLNTQFKIWLTSMDMKKSLQTFSLIYKWLYPKDKFNVEDFQVIKKKPSVVHMKSIILDAFMEDIVIRRKAEYPPFGKIDESIRNPPKVTRKNKDATGKKIKRSKRVVEEESTREPIAEPTDNVPTKMAKEIIENFIINLQNYSQSNMDVDETYQKEDQFSNDAADEVMENNEFCKSPVYKNDEIDLDKDENAMDGDEIAYAEHNSEPDDLQDSCDLLNNDNIPTQDIVIKYDSDTPDLNENDTHDNEVNRTNEQVESADLFADTDEIPNEIKDVNCSSNNTKSNEVLKNGTSNGDITNLVAEVKSVNDKDELVEVSDNKTEPAMGSVEMKLKELEELTMKKFKGSLLDSIF